MNSKGFTLIELSIVLLIIGLITGGILAGKDMIRASIVRATLSQIEKYNTATNTFREKYGYLPGDINKYAANQFGFPARGQYAGEGDGNGVIEGVASNSSANNFGNQQTTGETAMFWVDLTQAHLIEESFNTASSFTLPSGAITGNAIDLYLPKARLGEGNYIYIYSGTYVGGSYKQNGINYFGFSAVAQMGGLACGQCMNSNTTLAVAEASRVDSKMDDGFPQTGRVVALYLKQGITWAGTGSYDTAGPYTSAVPGSATSCYDNSASPTGTPGVNGTAQHYSLEMNNGNGPNCALSFTFQ